MSQLSTLLWLRYRIFRNSFKSRGAAVRQLSNSIIVLIPFTLSIGVGIGLFVGILLFEQFRNSVLNAGMMTIQATLLFLMLVSQSSGASANFDPRRFVLYPIKLTKLYGLNLASGISEFSVLMLAPALTGSLLGLGIAFGHPVAGILALVLALVWVNAMFLCTGMLFTWLLSGRKRSREIVFALMIGSFTVMGQVIPQLMGTRLGGSLLRNFRPYRHAIVTALSWTPVGVWSDFFKTVAAGQLTAAYLHLLFVCMVWIGGAWTLGYLVFMRVATSPVASSSGTASSTAGNASPASSFLSLKLPFIPDQTAAVLAKELKYLVRNPATYLTSLSSLIIPLVLFRNGFKSGATAGAAGASSWWITIWVSYVFMANMHSFGAVFAYDSGGFRQYLLAPIRWTRLLLGKNMSVWIMVSVQISAILLAAELIDHNLTRDKMFLAVASMLIAMAIYSIVGNFLSIYFPYRLNFGMASRRGGNWSALNLVIQFGLLFVVAGLLLLPIGLGYWLKSHLAQDLMLLGMVIVSWPVYAMTLKKQGGMLEKKRFDISEVLTRSTDKA